MREYKITINKNQAKYLDDLLSFFCEKLTSRFIQRSLVTIIYDFYGGYYNIKITSQYMNVLKEYDKLFKQFLKEGGFKNDK